MNRRRHGFTLIELLIVIAIIGILIASIAVAVTKAKEFANNSDQKNNMKQLVTAIRVAEGFNNNRMPPAWGTYGMPAKGQTTAANTTLHMYMLPYLENKPAFDSVFGNSAVVTPIVGANTLNIKIFQSAMDPSMPANPAGVTSFVGNIRVFNNLASRTAWNATVSSVAADNGGVFGSDKVPDGPSNTIFFTTKYAACNGVNTQFYTIPSSTTTTNAPFFGIRYATAGPSENASTSPCWQISPSLATTGNSVCINTAMYYGHSYGSTPLAVALGDTSVRNLSYTITPTCYAYAVTPTDGNALDSSW